MEVRVYQRRNALFWAESAEMYKPRLGSPAGSVVRNLPANAGDTGLIPDLGRSYHAEGAAKSMSHNY